MELDGFFRTASEEWLLKNVDLPIELYNGDQPVIFYFLNDLLLKRHQRKQLLLPRFDKTDTVAIFSDYSGEQKGSRYSAYTFAFVDFNCIQSGFSLGMDIIREKYKLNDPYKEISFKDRKYGPIARSLEEYLMLSNNFLNGLVFTLLVEKSVISLSGQNEKLAVDNLVKVMVEGGYGDWKGNVAEKHQRIIQVIAYFCTLLVGNGKKVFWMTDQDSIVANSDMASSAAQLLVNAIGSCNKSKKYELVGYSPKPFGDDDDPMHFTDILSITDLVAGSVEQYFSKSAKSDDFEVDEAVDKILRWLSMQGLGLKKLIMRIDNNDGLKASLVDFELTEPFENAQYFDVVYDVSVTS